MEYLLSGGSAGLSTLPDGFVQFRVMLLDGSLIGINHRNQNGGGMSAPIGLYFTRILVPNMFLAAALAGRIGNDSDFSGTRS